MTLTALTAARSNIAWTLSTRSYTGRMVSVPHDRRAPIGEVTDLIRVGEVLPFRVLNEHERLLLNEAR